MAPCQPYAKQAACSDIEEVFGLFLSISFPLSQQKVRGGGVGFLACQDMDMSFAKLKLISGKSIVPLADFWGNLLHLSQKSPRNTIVPT